MTVLNLPAATSPNKIQRTRKIIIIITARQHKIGATIFQQQQQQRYKSNRWINFLWALYYSGGWLMMSPGIYWCALSTVNFSHQLQILNVCVERKFGVPSFDSAELRPRKGALDILINIGARFHYKIYSNELVELLSSVFHVSAHSLPLFFGCALKSWENWCYFCFC